MTRRISPRTNNEELPSLVLTAGAVPQASIEFGLDASKPYLAFTMKDLNSSGIVRKDTGNGFFIAIDPGQRWDITITLDPSWDWEFDTDPISFKDMAHAKHYKVTSVKQRTLVLRAHSRLAGSLPPPPPAWPAQSHLFNLYLVVKQSASRTYPMIIDPDVKNPPPGGSSIIAPANTPVPLA